MPGKRSESLCKRLRWNVSREGRRGNGLGGRRRSVNECNRHANGERAEHSGHHSRDLRRWLTHVTPRTLPVSLYALSGSVLPPTVSLILQLHPVRTGRINSPSARAAAEESRT